MRSEVLLLFFTLIYSNVAEVLRSNTLIETKVGSIQGLWDTEGNHSMYLGVPYGRVDESNPFGISVPYPAFDGIYEAFDDSRICPQPREGTTLDCLRMNIFVPPTAEPGSNFPVLFNIHGGGFSMSSGSRERFHGKFFMKHEVIVVSINYRLGPYGFFCLEIPEVPGNQGLKDQLLALRWVNENIEAFGGDPNSVTIFGESAGGMAVDTHLFSSPKKLFKGMIPMSGSTFIPEIASNHDKEAPMKLAAILGFNTNNVYDALSFLATANIDDVINGMSNLDRLLPCVEKEFDNVEIFLADYPMYINPTDAANISILLGFNSDECIECFGFKPLDFHADLIYDKIKLAFNFDDEQLLEAEQRMKHFYLGDEEANATNFVPLADFEADYKFIYPSVRSIRKYVENGAQDVYYYMFSYDGGRNINKMNINFTHPGAYHSDALGYLFHFENRDLPDPPAEEDQVMIDRMTTMWANFMRYGNPTPETTELLPVKWEPITSLDSPQYFLNIDYEMKLEMRPYHSRMAFWELFYQHYWQYVIGYRDENAPSSANTLRTVILLNLALLLFVKNTIFC